MSTKTSNTKTTKRGKKVKVEEALIPDLEKVISDSVEDNNADFMEKLRTGLSGAATEASVDDKLTIGDTWSVLDAYFGQCGKKQLLAHQINSFEQFIEQYIDDVIKQFNPITITHDFSKEFNKHKLVVEIEFMNYTIGSPTIVEPDGETIPMTPAIARLRNLTYSAPLTMDLMIRRIVWSRDMTNPDDNLDDNNIKEVTLRGINFGKIPIMVMSKYCVLRKHASVNPTQYGECAHDMGGYFIINGNEKVVIGQERIAENKVFVFSKQKQNKAREFEAEVRSIQDDCFSIVMTNIIKYNEKAKTFTLDISTFKNPVNVFLVMRALGIETDKDLLECVCFEFKDNTIGTNIGLMCKETLLDFKSTCGAANINTPEEVLGYLIEHVKFKGLSKEIELSHNDKVAYLKTCLEHELLPHCRKDFIKKANYLAVMLRKLIKVKIGIMPFDDRDNFQNKRVETTGYLMASLLRQCINRLTKDMQRSIEKEMQTNKSDKDIFDLVNINNIYKFVKPTSVEGGLKYSLATGNWGVKTSGKGKIKVGTAQVLNRLSYPSYLSHERRMNCPSDKRKKNNKIVGPRKQHASQWGYICPAETPEGAPVGLVKNMSIGSTITLQYNSGPLREWLARTGIVSLPTTNYSAFGNKCIIFVNGDIVGAHDNPVAVFNRFKHIRRCGKIHPYISVYWDMLNNEMSFFTDAGRLIRPIYIVDADNTLRITKNHIDRLKSNDYNWNYLVMPSVDKIIQRDTIDIYTGVAKIKELNSYSEDDKRVQGVIEFIDIEEVNNCMIAMTQSMLETRTAQYITQYTHREIHPGLILGVLACVIPFPDHNQSPRNAYQSSMGKQAMGWPNMNFHKRLDTITYAINNIERPMVFSQFSKYTNYDKLPVGNNAIVAIGCYSGYNQEDSVILNGNSVDMGMFRTTYYHVYKDEEKKIQSNGKEEKFCKPDPEYTKGIKPGNYDKLDERGFVRENEYVTSKDVIMGKKLPIKNKYINGHQVFKDCSTSLKMNETGYIDKVFIDRNEEGFLSGKVRIRNERIPSIGSKFASRVGQKGTVGMILPKEEMPFMANGMVPDIIMTPHAIPSRMTVGQLLECLMGKMCAYTGGMSECTAFSDISPYQLGELLEANGFEHTGNEVLYSGITGKQLDVMLFTGPTYYQRLKHMAEDKVHCLTKDHQVLTKAKGWVFPDDVTMEDELFTLNKDTMQTEWQNPTHLNNYDAESRDMYHIKNYFIDTMVTNEHRLLCKISCIYGGEEIMFITAEDLYENYIDNTDVTIKLPSYNNKNNKVTWHEIDYFDRYNEPPAVNKIELTAEVWCPTVPNEIFYVRRNGKEYFTGNSRNSGPVVQLTRQPAEGRSRDGGLRIGEMEKDCIGAHGAVAFLKERLLDVSDKFEVYICANPKCGNYAIVNPDENVQLYRCNNCDNSNSFNMVEIPYAAKLLSQELQGMGLNMRFFFERLEHAKPGLQTATTV